MKQSMSNRSKELFHGSDVIRRYSFKTIVIRHICALLARANRQLAQKYDASGYKCAHFRKTDCFECLSPHKTAA